MKSPFEKRYCKSATSFQRSTLWKLCPQINTAKLIANDKLNIKEKIKGTGNCKESEIIYATQCSKRKVLYIGHTREQLSERFSKHRYNIKNRSDNSELARHFHENHNLNDSLNVTILQNNIKTAAARRYHEASEFVS